MTDPRRLAPDEQELWDTFYVMRRRFDKALDAQLSRDFGVSISELEILMSLVSAPERRMRVRELVAQLRWEKSRVSHQVTRMVRRGLVERQTCPEDARAMNIHLTSEGRRIVVRALPSHIATIRALLIEPLDAAQRAGLLEAAQRVTTAIEELEGLEARD